MRLLLDTHASIWWDSAPSRDCRVITYGHTQGGLGRDHERTDARVACGPEQHVSGRGDCRSADPRSACRGPRHADGRPHSGSASTLDDAVRVERGVAVPRRDGVKLIADVYLPPGKGPWPVILIRTPYNRAAGEGAAQPFRAHYAVVVQDTRGRYESGGEFTPFFSEGYDGYDSVEWAAVQPWSNGKVGMAGGSYLGIVQVLAAIARPPHLKALFPVVTPSNFYGDAVYTGGALRQELFQGWMTLMAHTAKPPSS